MSVFAGLLGLFFSQSVAIAVFTGAIIASLANAYFAWKVFYRAKSAANDAQPAKILTTYYGAEVGKIILTVMLFVTAFNAIKQLNVIALMCAYLFITMIPMLVSFFINTDEEDANTNWRDENVE